MKTMRKTGVVKPPLIHDPTDNVISLVQAYAESQAELRASDIRFNDRQHSHLKEMAALRAEQSKEARVFDREQAKNIREVDMANAVSSATQILNAVNTNASVAERTAQTLRDQVATTATAAENRLTSFSGDVMKRLSAVELSMSKGEGKGSGIDSTWKAILAVGLALLAFLTYQGGRITVAPNPSAPVIINMPGTPGTTPGTVAPTIR